MLLLLASLGASAQEQQRATPEQLDAQMRRIEAALNRLSTEQQSLYQQFQMVQEMRRGEMQRMYESTQTYTPPATPPDYDELVRQRNAREQRLQRYGDEIDRLYARYKDLDAQKQPLLDAMSEIARQR